jgi:predicted nucleic acid-binding Zn ribbon protein
MRYCASCGRSMPNDSKLCPYCGKTLDPNVSPIIKEKKDKTALIVVIVVVLIIIVPICVAATVYIYVSGMLSGGPSGAMTPFISFITDTTQGTLTVAFVDSGTYYWSDINLSGTGTLPTGIITEGDQITGCGGIIQLIYEPTAKLIGEWSFPE